MNFTTPGRRIQNTTRFSTFCLRSSRTKCFPAFRVCFCNVSLRAKEQKCNRPAYRSRSQNVSGGCQLRVRSCDAGMAKTSTLRLIGLTIGAAICCSVFLYRGLFFGVNAPSVSFWMFLACWLIVTLSTLMMRRVPWHIRIPCVAIFGGISIHYFLHESKFPQFWICICLVASISSSYLFIYPHEEQSERPS